MPILKFDDLTDIDLLNNLYPVELETGANTRIFRDDSEDKIIIATVDATKPLWYKNILSKTHGFEETD